MAIVDKPVTPIVIDLGSVSRKQIRKFKRGSGKLATEVTDVLERLRAQLGPDAANKELVPLLVVYSRKVDRSSSLIELLLDQDDDDDDDEDDDIEGKG